MSTTDARPDADAVTTVLNAMEQLHEDQLHEGATAEFDGETYYMNAAAASSAHGRALIRIATHLADQLHPGHECSTDTRVDFGGRNGAPDVVVADASAITTDTTPIPVTSVHLIVEVLSPSTRQHDLGWKLEAARAAGIDYWTVEPSAEQGRPWTAVTVHRFADTPLYVAP